MTTNALVRVSEIDANTSPERARKPVLTGGANRGALQMQRAFQEFNRASNRFTLSPIYADPVPERAALLVREAAKRGVPARAIEARVEEVLPSREFKHLPLILSVDNAEAIASALESVVLAERPVLIYFLIRLPNEELLGFRAVLQHGDEEHLKVGVRFFRKLAHVTARSGAAAVLGAEGRPEHLALEMAYRRWFADHMNANLTKIVAKIRPDSDPFEITTDGQTTMSLLMRESPNGWADPSVLAREVIESPAAAIARGRDFGVAEIGPDGVRLHIARVRALDGKPAIQAAAVVDPSAYNAADVERRERARRELQQSIERAERHTMSRTRPVFTTD
jgi:hypothetical protein